MLGEFHVRVVVLKACRVHLSKICEFPFYSFGVKKGLRIFTGHLLPWRVGATILIYVSALSLGFWT